MDNLTIKRLFNISDKEEFRKEFESLIPDIKGRIINFCHYDGRLLFLVEYTISGSYQVGLFYSSSGSCTPEVCGEGSVRPILGLVEPAFKNMYYVMCTCFPSMMNSRGWIGKGGTKADSDPNSYFMSLRQKYVSKRLEDTISSKKLDFKKEISYAEFLERIEHFYTLECFFPRYYLNKKIKQINA